MQHSHLGIIVQMLALNKRDHETALDNLRRDYEASDNTLFRIQKLEQYRIALGAYIMRAEQHEYKPFERWYETQKKWGFTNDYQV